jgi:cardiolipin synthase
MESTVFLVASMVGLAFLCLMLFLALFEPGLPYTITRAPARLDSPGFLRMLGALVDTDIHHGTRIEVLTNGEVYYEAELEAISAARHSINLEAYIFRKGAITRRFMAALAERARAGIHVNMVLDAVGSFATWPSYLSELRQAGARIHSYHPLRWPTLHRFNNRTHRELIIVDGRVGFIGGAGFGDQWRFDRGQTKRRWRDTMFRVEGDAVTSLQATFVENWIESSGEIPTLEAYFPECPPIGDATAIVVTSSPTTGRSTKARVLFQTLLACARRSLYITTPYFLPDKSVRAEMVRAIDRGVSVKIITPGTHTDQHLTRRSSRHLYGPLLRAGAEIYEYQPAMMHVKTLVVDELWSVVGSTNFDNRSFGLNDEVNLAACDAALAERLLEDFARDLAECCPITYNDWLRRSLLERCRGRLGTLLERQQ